MSNTLSARLIFVLFCITSLTCCSSAEYLVVTPGTFEQAKNQPIRKKLILFEDEDPTKPIEEFANLLNRKSWTEIERRINTLESGQQRLFVQGVMYLMVKDYAAAQNKLSALNENSFDCQVAILKTDILYRSRPKDVNFQDRYQHAFDCSDNPLIKSIAKDRFRLIRYEN